MDSLWKRVRDMTRTYSHTHYFILINRKENQRKIQNRVRYLRMERFVKTVNVYNPLTVLAIHSTLDVLKGSEYTSYQWLYIKTLQKYLGRQDWGSWCFSLRFLMFFLDVMFVLFTLQHWTPLNMCPIRRHKLYSYLTGLGFFYFVLNSTPLNRDVTCSRLYLHIKNMRGKCQMSNLFWRYS